MEYFESFGEMLCENEFIVDETSVTSNKILILQEHNRFIYTLNATSRHLFCNMSQVLSVGLSAVGNESYFKEIFEFNLNFIFYFFLEGLISLGLIYFGRKRLLK